MPNWLVFGALFAAAVALFALLGFGVRHAIGRIESGRSTKHVSAARPFDTDGMLVFTVADDHGSAVHSVTGATGRGPAVRTQVLTRGADLYGRASVSPDGSHIVYLHAACPRCPAAYEVKDSASGSIRVIGTAPQHSSLVGAPPEAAWSPDGRLAFVEQGLDSPQPELFLFATRTGTRAPLVPVDSASQDTPVWSPNGHEVAYLAGGDATVITLTDVTSGAAWRLNDQLPGASSLSWSPDGRYVSVLQNGRIWLVEAMNGHGFALTAPGTVVQLAGWAPDSRSLLAVVGTRDGAAGARTLIKIPLDGTQPLRLASDPGITEARWSPDGRYVAWATSDGSAWSIWLTSATGGAADRIATGHGAVSLDDWR